jgi:hypothetical protein
MRAFLLIAFAGLALGQTTPIVLPQGATITVVGQTGPPGKDGTASPTGASGALGDFRLVRVDATHATIGAACTALKPCNVHFNSKVLLVSTQAAITLSGTTTGVLTVWMDGTGAYFVGYPLGTTISCQGGAAVQATAVPANMFPIGTINFSVGAFNVDGITDLRASYGRDFVIPGFGLVGGPNGALGVDGTLFAQFAPPPVSSAGACSPPMWSYDAQYIYVCVGPNSWRRVQTGAW